MQSILLLHGALGSKTQFDVLTAQLSHNFDVHTLNFGGHGGNTNNPKHFRIELFASDVLAYMDEMELEVSNLFGYSMGGYVGLYLAKHFGHRIQKVITLATKLEWTENIAANEVKMLNPEIIEQKLHQFARNLKERHAPANWKEVMQKTVEMMMDLGSKPRLGDNDLQRIKHKTLLMIGDRDKMVSIDETIKAYRTMANASLAVLADTSHPIEGVNIEMLCEEITRFVGKNQ